MKNTENLKIANRDAYGDFVNKVMGEGNSIFYTKGIIPGYDGKINIKATCPETGEEMRIIWVEETKPENIN